MVATRNSFTHGAKKLKDGAIALKDSVYEKSTDALEAAAESADNFVQSRPYETALIAFCFGAACGTALGMYLAKDK